MAQANKIFQSLKDFFKNEDISLFGFFNENTYILRHENPLRCIT